MELFFLLLVGHAVCDFVLQGPVMGSGKSRRRWRSGEFAPDFPPWYAWLGAHALTHGGAVTLLSGSWGLGALEAVLHGVIDHLKCEERIGFHLDQGLHLLCKVAWVALAS